MNNFKTFLLMLFLMLLLLAVGAAFRLSGPAMVMLFVLGLGINFGMYWFSDSMVLASYGAQPLSESQAPELHEIVRRLSGKAGLPMPRIYLVDSDQPNAFATGRDPGHAVVAVTRGILQMLDRNELEGVLSHELSHVRNRDMLTATIAAGVASAISWLPFMAGGFFGGGRDDREGGSPVSGLLLMLLAPLVAMLVQMMVSRSREYEADRSGGVLTGHPLWLAGALRKISRGVERAPLEGAKPATAHLMIANPFSGRGLAGLFSTHPPMEERVAALERLDQELREG